MGSVCAGIRFICSGLRVNLMRPSVRASYQQRYACEYIQQRLQSWPAAEKFFII